MEYLRIKDNWWWIDSIGNHPLRRRHIKTVRYHLSQLFISNIWWSCTQLVEGLQFTYDFPNHASTLNTCMVNEFFLQNHLQHCSWGCRITSLTKCWLSREGVEDVVVVQGGGKVEEPLVPPEQTRINHWRQQEVLLPLEAKVQTLDNQIGKEE
jgi:hypothetical protein